MVISVINHTLGQITDEEVQTAIRAINRQIVEDYMPHWNTGATLRLEGKSGAEPKPQEAADVRGDAIIYLWSKTDVPGAHDYHESNRRGISYGFVFSELSQAVGESWTVTLSHAALELIGDAAVNLLVMGPHPGNRQQTVFHWYEMCDAVQAETYEIDGVALSNFVLPRYFRGEQSLEGRNDFLGRAHEGKTLESFGVNPGGYVGFFDPATAKHEKYIMKDDKRAVRRAEIKAVTEPLRRAGRHQVVGTGRETVRLLKAKAAGT